MDESIKLVEYALEPDPGGELARAYGVRVGERTAAWHRTIPDYAPTPLRRLSALASQLGLAGLYVKDESPRFGLNSFKALGGSYACARILADRLGMAEEVEADPGALNLAALMRRAIFARDRQVTFATATDGNHGRGVAWAAHMLVQRSVVNMPRGSSAERLANIRALGARAQVCDMVYDEVVRETARQARDNGWVLVQDTSWPGYEEVPRLIMQGYATLASELVSQLARSVAKPPTHVFLQAGVGSMAAAVAAYLADAYGDERPAIVVVEPNRADCLYRTAQAADGALHDAPGDLGSIMAGLSCGHPSQLAWDVLRRYARYYVSMPDWVAAKGMRVLGNPLGDDERVVSGESGASTTGLVCELMANESLYELRGRLGLGPDSRVVCVSTEGDTDRANYRRVVWDGLHPSF